MANLIINRQKNPTAIEITTPVISLAYLDYLQKQSAEDIAFYPKAALQKALDENHILSCEENGEPAGYLWFGAIRTDVDTTIYQAAIDYELRRQYLGYGLVQQLIEISKLANCSGIRLKCASSALSNLFWQSLGFYCTAIEQGGIKRQRDLNVYRLDLGATRPSIAIPPSVRQSDRSTYDKNRRKGTTDLPSRFSRSHY